MASPTFVVRSSIFFLLSSLSLAQQLTVQCYGGAAVDTTISGYSTCDNNIFSATNPLIQQPAANIGTGLDLQGCADLCTATSGCVAAGLSGDTCSVYTGTLTQDDVSDLDPSNNDFVLFLNAALGSTQTTTTTTITAMTTTSSTTSSMDSMTSSSSFTSTQSMSSTQSTTSSNIMSSMSSSIVPSQSSSGSITGSSSSMSMTAGSTSVSGTASQTSQTSQPSGFSSSTTGTANIKTGTSSTLTITSPTSSATGIIVTSQTGPTCPGNAAQLYTDSTTGDTYDILCPGVNVPAKRSSPLYRRQAAVGSFATCINACSFVTGCESVIFNPTNGDCFLYTCLELPILGYYGAELVSTPMDPAVVLTPCPVTFTPGLVGTGNFASFVVNGGANTISNVNNVNNVNNIQNNNNAVTSNVVNNSVSNSYNLTIICTTGTCGVDVGVCTAWNCRCTGLSGSPPPESVAGSGTSIGANTSGSFPPPNGPGLGPGSGYGLESSTGPGSAVGSGAGTGSGTGSSGASSGGSTYTGPSSNSAVDIGQQSFTSLVLGLALAFLL